MENFLDIDLNMDVYEEDASGGTITTEPLAKKVALNIPGGYKEAPSSKPYDAATINVPGLGEKPSNPGYNDGYINMSIPSSNAITADAYNAALKNLQTSFNEGAKLMETLQQIQVIPECTDDEVYEFVKGVFESGDICPKPTAADKAMHIKFREGTPLTSTEKTRIKSVMMGMFKHPEVKKAFKPDRLERFKTDLSNRVDNLINLNAKGKKLGDGMEEELFGDLERKYPELKVLGGL